MDHIFTFSLNFATATADSYANWATVWLHGNLVLRKSNAGGNGQTWELLGYLLDTEQATLVRLFTGSNPQESEAARIVATVLSRLGLDVNVNGYGCTYPNASWRAPVRSLDTRRWLTAAPSIEAGRVTRDKNRDMERERLGGGFDTRYGSENCLTENPVDNSNPLLDNPPDNSNPLLRWRENRD